MHVTSIYLEYMHAVAVDLLSRRSERKKRSTASSQFHYGNFDIDVSRYVV